MEKIEKGQNLSSRLREIKEILTEDEDDQAKNDEKPEVKKNVKFR